MTLHRTPVPGSRSPISRAVEVGTGRRLVVFSAQMPPVVKADADPRSLEAFGDTRQQTEGCLERIETVLREAGLTLDDLVGVRVYLVADPRTGAMDFDGFNAGWARFFERAAAHPTRTVVHVAGLVNPGWLLELEPTAAR